MAAICSSARREQRQGQGCPPTQARLRRAPRHPEPHQDKLRREQTHVSASIAWPRRGPVWHAPTPPPAGYGCTESPSGAGKTPENGGWAAHKAEQLDAASGSAGTERAPVAARPLLRIWMFLPSAGAEWAR